MLRRSCLLLSLLALCACGVPEIPPELLAPGGQGGAAGSAGSSPQAGSGGSAGSAGDAGQSAGGSAGAGGSSAGAGGGDAGGGGTSGAAGTGGGLPLFCNTCLDEKCDTLEGGSKCSADPDCVYMRGCLADKCGYVTSLEQAQNCLAQCNFTPAQQAKMASLGLLLPCLQEQCDKECQVAPLYPVCEACLAREDCKGGGLLSEAAAEPELRPALGCLLGKCQTGDLAACAESSCGLDPAGVVYVLAAEYFTQCGAKQCAYACVTSGPVACDSCKQDRCRSSFEACAAEPSCAPCLSDPGGAGCDAQALLLAHQGCLCKENCGSACQLSCPTCGNGLREGDEICDGDDLGSGVACPGETPNGKPTCTSNCGAIDYISCSACNDNEVVPLEVCPRALPGLSDGGVAAVANIDLDTPLRDELLLASGVNLSIYGLNNIDTGFDQLATIDVKAAFSSPPTQFDILHVDTVALRSPPPIIKQDGSRYVVAALEADGVGKLCALGVKSKNPNPGIELRLDDTSIACHNLGGRPTALGVLPDPSGSESDAVVVGFLNVGNNTWGLDILRLEASGWTSLGGANPDGPVYKIVVAQIDDDGAADFLSLGQRINAFRFVGGKVTSLGGPVSPSTEVAEAAILDDTPGAPLFLFFDGVTPRTLRYPKDSGYQAQLGDVLGLQLSAGDRLDSGRMEGGPLRSVVISFLNDAEVLAASGTGEGNALQFAPTTSPILYTTAGHRRPLTGMFRPNTNNLASFVLVDNETMLYIPEP